MVIFLWYCSCLGIIWFRHLHQVDDDRGIAPQAILAIEHKKSKDNHEKSDVVLAPTAATPEPSAAETAKAPVNDLLVRTSISDALEYADG